MKKSSVQFFSAKKKFLKISVQKINIKTNKEQLIDFFEKLKKYVTDNFGSHKVTRIGICFRMKKCN